MAGLINPYPPDGTWLTGNLHAHTTNSDGERTPEQVVTDYVARGFDFLALSDHDTLTDPAAIATETAVQLIPAVEVSANGSHLLHLGADGAIDPNPDRQVVVDAIGSAGGLAVPAHPNWKESFAHWPVEQLIDLGGITGIEVYNGLVERHPGSPLATDRWDQLLAAGVRAWGLANDDSHRPGDVAVAWNVVRAADRSVSSILDALAGGSFYASTGVTIRDVAVTDDLVTVETTNADQIRLISDHGVVQQTVNDRTAQFRIPEQLVYRSDHTYVRIECVGCAGQMAWLQPMFLA